MQGEGPQGGVPGHRSQMTEAVDAVTWLRKARWRTQAGPSPQRREVGEQPSRRRFAGGVGAALGQHEVRLQRGHHWPSCPQLTPAAGTVALMSLGPTHSRSATHRR